MPEHESTSTLHTVDRRRERRIAVHVPIEITLTDDQGREFTQRTFIEDVSDFGCRFSTRGPARKGSTVVVKLIGPNGKVLPDDEPRIYEIMWVSPKQNGHAVGAQLRQGEKLNHSQIPPENNGPAQDAK